MTKQLLFSISKIRLSTQKQFSVVRARRSSAVTLEICVAVLPNATIWHVLYFEMSMLIPLKT